MFWLTLLLCLFIIYLINKYIISPYLLIHYYRSQGINHVFFMPVLGFFFFVLKSYIKHRDALYFLKDYVAKHPEAKILMFNLWDNIHFIIIDIEIMKDYLIKNMNYLASDHEHTLRPLIGYNNIVFAENENWKKRRKLFSFGFTFDIIRKLTYDIEPIVEKYIKEIEKDDLKKINLLSYFENMTGEFMINSMIGADNNIKIDGVSIASTFMKNVEIAFDRMMTPLFALFGQRIFNYAFFGKEKQNNKKFQKFRDVMSLELKRLENLQNKEPKFIDYLIKTIKENNEYYDINLIDEISVMIGAGIDTTTHLIQYILMELENNGLALAKLREEIKKFIKNENDFNYDNIENMIYLNSIIKETLRIRTPAPLGLTKIAQKNIKLGNFNFKKGTSFNAGFIFNNLNEKYFKEPHCFKPERWIEINENKIDNLVFTPFSAGQRTCLGQHFALIQTKIILIKLLNKFNFKFIKNQDYRMLITISHRQDRPIYFELEKI